MTVVEIGVLFLNFDAISLGTVGGGSGWARVHIVWHEIERTKDMEWDFAIEPESLKADGGDLLSLLV